MGSGAYGYTVTGIGAGHGLVDDVPESWPPIALSQTRIDPKGTSTRLIGGGHLSVDVEDGAATIHRDEALSPDALVHPYLAPIAARFAVAEGSVPFHAGAFVSGGATWLVVGPREAGKSSLMAALAARSIPIVSDDLVVVRDRAVMAGPRTLDLRRDVAERFPGARQIADAGQRERWRLELDAVEPVLPGVGGAFRLGWSESVGVTPVEGAAARMEVLLGALSNSSEINVPAVMSMAIGQVHDVRRPRDWQAGDATIDAMLELT